MNRYTTRRNFCARVTQLFVLIFILLLTPLRVSAVGWTPTDGGLVVNLNQGDEILISTIIDGKEYFITNYNRYEGPGDIFNYEQGSYLKLLPQPADTTYPSSMAIWTVGAPLDRVDKDNVANLGNNNNYFLNGIVYTIWNDGKTLRTHSTERYKFFGDLTENYDDKAACDVVFVIPTDRKGIVSFDPNCTLERDDQQETNAVDDPARKGRFNGKMGYNSQFGLYYREVYMMEIPRFNAEVSYTNAALVTFNTTQSNITTWRNAGTVKKGHAAWAYADNDGTSYHNTTRTIFRLYVLNDPINSCDSYFFATDEQDYKKYRKGPGGKQKLQWKDSTDYKKIYTWDHFYCMQKQTDPKIYKSDWMYVPTVDSTYYYVGKRNKYINAGETNDTLKLNPNATSTAVSQFKRIDSLRVLALKDQTTDAGKPFIAPKGAYGRMVVDTTSTKQNLGVAFEPNGYMLKVSTGTNVQMHESDTEPGKWITEQMWTIDSTFFKLSLKATLMTCPEFSATDPGADIAGWSEMMSGQQIKEQCGVDFVGEAGWAIIDTKAPQKNGNITFVIGDSTLRIHYDNNGFSGTQISDQYPKKLGSEDAEKGKVTIMSGRLSSSYTFLGWSTSPSGPANPAYAPGTTIDLDDELASAPVENGKKTLTLYAQAAYDGMLQIALSFIHPTNGKRYFLNTPGTAAPRYARARHYDNWDNTWQGMENVDNLDPNYLSTFELRHPSNEVKAHKDGLDGADTLLKINEKVLDPRRYTMHGKVDSLTFYEFFAPNKDVYLGLYYMDPNTIVANNTWAGLFESDRTDTTITGWPDSQHPYIHGATLKSTRYVQEEDPVRHPDSLTLKKRTNDDKPFVKYNKDDNQFDGVAEGDSPTKFDLSAIAVADEHFIILPDTSEVWRDTITFGYHKDEQISEDVWSKLIGKQLMATMRIGNDTVYFHPNRNKIINDPNNLYLSPDFRMSETFELIPDARVTSVADSNRVTHEATSYHWHRQIVSGENSPMNVMHGGKYIDIIDTLRITLIQGGVSKVKGYRGRWKKQRANDGLTVNGLSRYRDVIIRTKTYHYGPEKSRLVFKASQDSYNFNALKDDEHTIEFTLTKETYQELMDAQGRLIGEEKIVDTKDTTSALLLLTTDCAFSSGSPSTYFSVSEPTSAAVTLTTKAENAEGANQDVMTVSHTLSFNGKDTTVTTSVSLTQAALSGDELVWSVYHKTNKTRYFIMAVNDGSTTTLQFRQFTLHDNTYYKRNTTTHLVKGSGVAGNNSDGKYITPWKFSYNQALQQIYLQTKYGINKSFAIKDIKGTVAALNDSTILTYYYYDVNTNSNANFEEKVKLSYGADQWLAFDPSTGISLVPDSADASVFSWGYLLPEYSLLNNGAYPNQSEAFFEYNNGDAEDIQTRYMAYREYSMLLDNTLTYLGRKEVTRIDSLTDATKEWKTSYTITHKRDRRTFDVGASATSSGLEITTDTTLTTFIKPKLDSITSPTNVMINGKYVNIVDTLAITLSESAPQTYRFKEDWSDFTSISDANLKIPLVRMTYHTAPFDSLVCVATRGQNTHYFPAVDAVGKEYTFQLSTLRRKGTKMVDVDNNVVAEVSATSTYITRHVDANNTGMHLNDPDSAEVRLIDEYGNTPSWCEIVAKGDSTITVQCTQEGIRTPRSAYIYLAYIIRNAGVLKFVNYRLTVSQPGKFSYDARQTLIHSRGASDDSLAYGRQQVHENKRIIYYYPDEEIDLPVRERAFYGWWRWYREGKDSLGTDVGDTDVPDELWVKPPVNDGKYKFPYRKIIVDSVWVDDTDHTKGKKLGRTMGRYTVFHYKAKDYNNKQDPPSKNPMVVAPTDKFTGKKPILTYVADISNYYDRLPLSLSQKNQVDTKKLDTLSRINEPTLSLREIFELHPWTEMADMLEKYKYIESVSDNRDIGRTTYDSTYMEDHILMAPLDNKLLLRTEQRYSKSQLEADGFAEGLLGYYTHDDNWKDGGWSQVRKDSMIWCIGWDQDCHWYTYTPKTGSYEECSHSIKTEDILEIPAKKSISSGHVFDTVYYCLRARSKKTTGTPGSGSETTTPGDYWFNICRYMVIYHRPDKYGPKLEEKQKNGITKAIMTNDEIEETYEVLEKLNFDYNKPGSDYAIYPHPLPWADASYGFMYPETPNLPHNRYHDQSDFPNHGEYGLINRIPYSDYWKKMEQHGGAANGYMIYCDGMASAGQVAALHLETNLCAGQQMYFSGYVGNPSSQKSSSQDPVNGKSEPNFTFAVQASTDGTTWDNITEYTTGDIAPSDKWRQILFPINFSSSKSYTHFRVRIFNVASSFDGNDFVIDDMRLFATKAPLIAYQAQTKCVAMNEKKDSTTQVVLRIDYQGFTSDDYNGKDVYYTVQKIKGDDTAYVKMDDHYLNEKFGKDAPSVFGSVLTPTQNYMPSEEDSVFSNLTNLIEYVNGTKGEHKIGYIFENVNGIVRPVMYIIHEAKMTPDNVYKVRMSLDSLQLNSSICAMTSNLKVTNKMVLDLNGEERPDMEVSGMCANTTYDISMRVRGTLHLDSIAPIDLNGSCVNDWLVGGDTAKASSRRRYGFYYKDIVKVVKDILRCEPQSGKNINQFAPNLSSVSRNEMGRFWDNNNGVRLDTTGVHPYDILAHLVNNGHLILYQSKLTETVALNDSIEFVVMPILGTGSDAVRDSKIEVCPEPVYIKLKSTKGGHIPMSIGGAKHGETPVILAGSSDAEHEMTVRIDSLMDNVKLDTIITLRSTNDPGYLEGSHRLNLVPDKTRYPGKGSMIKLRPARNNNYVMRGGYSYTFEITMVTLTGSATWPSGTNEGCPVGTVPFTVSVVPDQLRWEPQSKDNNKWNNPDNWIGVTPQNVPIHADAHFAPLSTSSVLIPTMPDTLPYPYIPAPTEISRTDSVRHTGFEYNKCNVIRFMPGAAMAQQQNLTCTDAVIDMTMPNKKWALRATPVEGMLTGDIYMSEADFAGETPLWEVGGFDVSGRNYQTGNASFWLSLYNSVVRTRGKVSNDTVAANAEWSKITNSITLPLQPTQGFAVYTRTTSDKDAIVRLPKEDDIYYYYGVYGDRMDDYYEPDIRAKRNAASPGGNTAGKLAFRPDGTGKHQYTLTNGATSAVDMLFFGNPTMGYIDIWGFIADNSALANEIGFLKESGSASIYYTITKESAEVTADTITNIRRYLPPMHVIALKLNASLAAGADLNVNLYSKRIVTHPRQVERPASAPRRTSSNGLSRGIMTVTALNPVSARCKSQLQLGQGYHAAILDGEDAMLTTLNIDNYTNNTTPSTPFNIYAVENNYGLCVDLRDQILNVPLSFLMSELPFAPTTQLWFTGVYNIDGELVHYDAQTNTERRILDGIRLDIETPEQSHEVRYYIRRRGFDPNNPNDPTSPIATTVQTNELEDIPVTKIIRDGHVLVLRNGHIYTMFGQKIK